MKHFIILLVLFLISCEQTTQINQDSLISIQGQVINESTNGLNSDVSIALVRDIGTQIIDSCTTDEDGKFIVHYNSDEHKGFNLILMANFYNNNPSFPTKFFSPTFGENINHDFYIFTYSTVKVELKSENILTDSDYFKLEMPEFTTTGYGPIQNPIFIDQKAKSNLFNTIKFTYERNDTSHTIIDSIFCTKDAINTITINY